MLIVLRWKQSTERERESCRNSIYRLLSFIFFNQGNEVYIKTTDKSYTLCKLWQCSAMYCSKYKMR